MLATSRRGPTKLLERQVEGPAQTPAEWRVAGGCVSITANDSAWLGKTIREVRGSSERELFLPPQFPATRIV